MASQFGLETFNADATSMRLPLATLGGPVVLASWSYGAAVIDKATRDAQSVKALAQCRSVCTRPGESVGHSPKRHPGSLVPQHVVVAAEYSDTDRTHFGEVIAGNSPPITPCRARPCKAGAHRPSPGGGGGAALGLSRLAACFGASLCQDSLRQELDYRFELETMRTVAPGNPRPEDPGDPPGVLLQ